MRVQLGDDTIYQPLGDEVVLLNMQDQRYFGLDDVGADMWKLLVECGDTDLTAERMCTIYEVDKAKVEADLSVLTRDLLAAGLLKCVDSPR